MHLGRFIAVTAGLALFTGATALSPVTGTALAVFGGMALAGRAWGHVSVRDVSENHQLYQFKCVGTSDYSQIPVYLRAQVVEECQTPIVYDAQRHPDLCVSDGNPFFAFPYAVDWCRDALWSSRREGIVYSPVCQDGEVLHYCNETTEAPTHATTKISTDLPITDRTDDYADNYNDHADSIGIGAGVGIGTMGIFGATVGILAYRKQKRAEHQQALDKLPLVQYDANEEELTIGAKEPKPEPMTPPLEDMSDYCMRDLINKEALV